MVTKHILEIYKRKKYAQPLYEIVYIVGDKNGLSEEIKSVIMEPGIPTRDEVISAIIMDMYPLDKMQAVQNNYLLDPNDEEAIAEMNVMQEWRAYAKAVADEFIEYLNNNN